MTADLFTEIEARTTIRPAPDGDWRPTVDPGPDDDSYPQDDELEAMFLGYDRAGVPSWSSVSGKRLADARERLYASVSLERRAFLEGVEREAYQAQRRKRVALAAMERGMVE